MTVPRRQASKQAAWRIRIRSTSGAVMLLIVVLVVGGVYLAVNAKMARTGREVLVQEARRTELRRINAELTSELAELTAPDRLVLLAAAMGFRPARQDEVEYVLVEGYQPDEPFIAPRPVSWEDDSTLSLSPAYSETLGQWLTRFLAGESVR
jgi:hypothetical protein